MKKIINALPKVLVLLSKIVGETVKKVEKINFMKGLYILETSDKKLLFNEEDLKHCNISKKYSQPVLGTGNLLVLNRPRTKKYLAIPTDFLNHQILFEAEKIWTFKEIPGLIAYCQTPLELKTGEFHLITGKGEINGKYYFEERPRPVKVANLSATYAVFKDTNQAFKIINLETREVWISNQKPPVVLKIGIVLVSRIGGEFILLDRKGTSCLHRYDLKISERKDAPLLVLEGSYICLVNSDLRTFDCKKNSEITIPSKYPIAICNYKLDNGKIRSILLNYETMERIGDECLKEIYQFEGFDHIFILPNMLNQQKDSVHIYNAKTKKLSEPIKNPKFWVEGKKLEVKSQISG